MLHASRRIWGYPLRTRVRRGGASSRRSGCGALARTRASSFGWPVSPEVPVVAEDEEAGLERAGARDVLE
eukprot:2342056-Alexandrium_andersonii.AAC.1